MAGEHIDSKGRFQSDKYPTTPPDLVPLSVHDVSARPLLWQYAEGHRGKDAAFADDLQARLLKVGYTPPATRATRGAGFTEPTSASVSNRWATPCASRSS